MKPMKKRLMNLVRWVGVSLLWAALASAPASAQGGRLNIDDLRHLEDKASGVTDVTVDERTLKLGSAFLSPRRSADEAKIKELLSALKGVYVKVFEFDQDNAYSLSDLDGLRAQLRSPEWSRIVNVRSKRDGDNVEVYLLGEVDKVQGVAVIVAAPRELVVVNVVGPIDLEKISELEGHFGIPELDLKLDLGRKIKE